MTAWEYAIKRHWEANKEYLDYVVKTDKEGGINYFKDESLNELVRLGKARDKTEKACHIERLRAQDHSPDEVKEWIRKAEEKGLF